MLSWVAERGGLSNRLVAVWYVVFRIWGSFKCANLRVGKSVLNKPIFLNKKLVRFVSVYKLSELTLEVNCSE